MNKKITYLLGAGASANALPVVGALTERFENFCKHFFDYLKHGSRPSESLRIAQENSHLLISNLQAHYTVDTYAKKLYLQSRLNGENSEYELLKKYLSAFFIYEQIHIDVGEECNSYLRKKIEPPVDFPLPEQLEFVNKVTKDFDYRYDSFFASVLRVNNNSREIEIPEAVNIISWNYDYQVEKAFMNFSNSSLHSACHRIKIFGAFNAKNLDESINYSLIKLNGTAGFSDGSSIRNLIDFKKDSLSSPVFEIFEYELLQRKSTYPNGIRFAWEDNNISKKAIGIAKTKITQSEIIVIIGYSFPYFNRDTDREIFGELLNTRHRKVYIQAPSETIDSTVNRFNAIVPDYKVLKFTEIDQFLIPNEF